MRFALCTLIFIGLAAPLSAEPQLRSVDKWELDQRKPELELSAATMLIDALYRDKKEEAIALPSPDDRRFLVLHRRPTAGGYAASFHGPSGEPLYDMTLPKAWAIPAPDALAWSPAGHAIAFAASTGKNTQVFVSSLNGKAKQLSALQGQQTVTIHWSADSHRFAFLARPASGSAKAYMVIPGKPPLVMQEAERAAWAPDSSKLALANSGNPPQVTLYSRQGLKQRDVLEEGMLDESAKDTVVSRLGWSAGDRLQFGLGRPSPEGIKDERFFEAVLR